MQKLQKELSDSRQALVEKHSRANRDKRSEQQKVQREQQEQHERAHEALQRQQPAPQANPNSAHLLAHEAHRQRQEQLRQRQDQERIQQQQQQQQDRDQLLQQQSLEREQLLQEHQQRQQQERDRALQERHGLQQKIQMRHDLDRQAQQQEQQEQQLTPAQKKGRALLKKALASTTAEASGDSPVQKPGGVLFIDEAHMLEPETSKVGRAILNEIMGAADDHRAVLTIILAGYKEDIERNLYGFDVGLKSRFKDIEFPDYGEGELRQIWQTLVEKRGWLVEDDVSKVAVRRVARRKNQRGFGNGRDLREALQLAAFHATARVDFDPRRPTIIMDDVLGPKPTAENLDELRAALQSLHGMEGLESVKKAVDEIVKLNLENWKAEMSGQKIREIKKNRLFWGNPGTGKTTCAEIYGAVLKSLRLLSNGQVLIKTASDFVGNVVGDSANKTSAILAMAKGKVLVIDEACEFSLALCFLLPAALTGPNPPRGR